jgi:hypothetical protein
VGTSVLFQPTHSRFAFCVCGRIDTVEPVVPRKL